MSSARNLAWLCVCVVLLSALSTRAIWAAVLDPTKLPRQNHAFVGAWEIASPLTKADCFIFGRIGVPDEKGEIAGRWGGCLVESRAGVVKLVDFFDEALLNHLQLHKLPGRIVLGVYFTVGTYNYMVRLYEVRPQGLVPIRGRPVESNMHSIMVDGSRIVVKNRDHDSANEFFVISEYRLHGLDCVLVGSHHEPAVDQLLPRDEIDCSSRSTVVVPLTVESEAPCAFFEKTDIAVAHLRAGSQTNTPSSRRALLLFLKPRKLAAAGTGEGWFALDLFEGRDVAFRSVLSAIQPLQAVSYRTPDGLYALRLYANDYSDHFTMLSHMPVTSNLKPVVVTDGIITATDLSLESGRPMKSSRNYRIVGLECLPIPGEK